MEVLCISSLRLCIVIHLSEAWRDVCPFLSPDHARLPRIATRRLYITQDSSKYICKQCLRPRSMNLHRWMFRGLHFHRPLSVPIRSSPPLSSWSATPSSCLLAKASTHRWDPPPPSRRRLYVVERSSLVARGYLCGPRRWRGRRRSIVSRLAVDEAFSTWQGNFESTMSSGRYVCYRWVWRKLQLGAEQLRTVNQSGALRQASVDLLDN